MDGLGKGGAARLLPLVLAAALRVKVGEQAQHLNLDLAELRLSEEIVEVWVQWLKHWWQYENLKKCHGT